MDELMNTINEEVTEEQVEEAPAKPKNKKLIRVLAIVCCVALALSLGRKKGSLAVFLPPSSLGFGGGRGSHQEAFSVHSLWACCRGTQPRRR